MTDVSPNSCSNRIHDYNPFVADVSDNVYAEPFPLGPDTLSQEEITRIQEETRRIIKKKVFPQPIPLKNYCLVAKEKWDEDEESTQCHCVIL